MSDSTLSKKIMLKSSDGGVYVVSETVAKQSKTICQMIEDASTENFIRLNVTAPILEKVIEYCRKHVDAADQLRNWDKKFVEKHVDQEMLFDLFRAANYLDIKGLKDVTCEMAADRIIVTRGKSPEEFGITSKEKLSPDQEEDE